MKHFPIYSENVKKKKQSETYRWHVESINKEYFSAFIWETFPANYRNVLLLQFMIGYFANESNEKVFTILNNEFRLNFLEICYYVTADFTMKIELFHNIYWFYFFLSFFFYRSHLPVPSSGKKEANLFSILKNSIGKVGVCSLI